MLNNQEKCQRITNSAEKVRKAVIKALNQTDLTKEQLIEVIAVMAAEEYAEAKSENYRISIESQVQIVLSAVISVAPEIDILEKN